MALAHAYAAVGNSFFVVGNHGNALRTVVVDVTPPSIIVNDITGFTLHSESSRVGDLDDGR